VRFKHEEPPDTSEHTRIFGCPVRFGADVNAIVFDPALLALPLRSADPVLAEILAAADDEALARLPGTTSTADVVRRRLPELLTNGEATLAVTARAVGMSERSLQRRLRDDGVSYQKLLDDVRRELAEHYLARDDLSTADVAFLVGFSDPASFHRAFKRWTGVTPAQHRQRR
jgi:AraC-like DNA-binding protein